MTHLYPFLGDKLIVGKFCAIARGIEFVMNGANHRMKSVTTYPFYIMGGGWEQFALALEDLPFKGDTVIGNDVWIGQNVTVLPGAHIGDVSYYSRKFRCGKRCARLLRCWRKPVQGNPKAL